MISVIVPVYNAEKYLQDAIDSVFMQSHNDWELILVNDGSTDDSGLICDKAARKSSRVKVINTPNRGVSAARNTGLTHARGSHITFLDADDMLPPASLALMMDCALQFKADIVCGKIKEADSGISLPANPELYKNREMKYYRVSSYTPEKAVRKMLYQSHIDNSACGKLYAAELWKNLRFPIDMRYEDLAIVPMVFLNADKVKVLHKTVYIYRQQPESYVHTFSLHRADVLSVTSLLSEHLTRHHPYLQRAARARELNANFNILGLIAANTDQPDNEKDNLSQDERTKAMLLSDRCWNKIKELRGEALRNPSVRLKTKLGILVSYIGGRPLLEYLSKRIY